MIPSNDFEFYELATELFSDYARKRRFIKIPTGTKIQGSGEGLPDFPDSTVLVKTFYYFHDERDTTKGKRLLETRLIFKSNGVWNVATYRWNDEQNEARLMTAGLNTSVNWIDTDGNAQVVAYRIPSNRECAACHTSAGSVMPIGPKLRNLNMDVLRNSVSMNQLNYFHSIGILEEVNPGSIDKLPKWDDTSLPIEGRARAYLDVNCGHCHNRNAKDSNLRLGYEVPFSDTRIGKKKQAIEEQMQQAKMPQIGTTVVHEEGLELIREYVRSLN